MSPAASSLRRTLSVLVRITIGRAVSFASSSSIASAALNIDR